MIEFEFSDETSGISGREMEKAWLLFQRPETGFFELPARQQIWQDSNRRAVEIRTAFDLTCVIGIGGSSLGGRALNASFAGRNAHRVHFAEAPDERAANQWREEIDLLERVHFIFISKSGRTLETLALLDYWTQILKDSGLNIARQSTVICGASPSPLRQWAEHESVPILAVPEDVGGRFSVLSPVGLVPAALMGVDLERLRAGARWAVSQKDMALKLSAISQQCFEKERWVTQLWVYSSAFHILGLWWQQLWSESLGKKTAARVSTPMVCLGPQDQHSLLQQLQEGAADKSVILFRDLDAERSGLVFRSTNLSRLDSSFQNVSLGDVLKAEVDGFRGALNDAGIMNFTIKASSSRPESWGAFFMIWEIAICILGEHLGINAFDQPGVELGKRLALESLRRRL